MRHSCQTALLGLVLAMLPFPAHAVEDALGRTPPGVWVMPRIGVVGPNSGLAFALIPVGYVGSLSRGANGLRVAAPLAGSLVADVATNINVNVLVSQYVYKTETKRVNFS